MHTPYTATPGEAFFVAQSATAVAAMGVTWVQRRVLRIGTPFVLFAIACTILANPLPGFLAALHRPSIDPDLTLHVLRVGAWCFLIGALLARGSIGAKIAAIAMHVAASYGNRYFLDSTWEVTVMHLTLGMASVGLVTRGPSAPARGRAFSVDEEAAQDVAHFLVPTVLAAIVGKYVLRSGIDSSDEWAYTFQAHVYAKLQSYSVASPCGHAFQNFWVFDWGGKRFSQYLPGWPLYLVPFVWLRSLWLAGPVSLGVLAVGCGRLARRLVDRPARPWAASIAVMTLALASTCLINGGSRFPHLWVGACFAWSLESLLRCGEVTTRRARIAWGAAFGVATVWLLSTRLSDGLLLGTGVAVLFVVQLVRRRIALVSFAAGLATALVFGGWTLWVLHQQLGVWFTTGYSINEFIHPWNKYEFGKPEPAEWKWGFPLATGAYCWFPASVALGMFGLARARRGSRVLAVAMVFSATALLVFYAFFKVGHGFDWGYGPRYQLPTIVLWSVGTGAAVAAVAERTARGLRLWERARAVGPFVASTLLATLLLAPMLYPINTDSVMKLEEVNDRVRDHGVHDAIVIVGASGTGERGGLDLTQNLPLDLYPNQSVLIAQPVTADEDRCLRDTYPTRSFWEARGNPVTLTRSP